MLKHTACTHLTKIKYGYDYNNYQCIYRDYIKYIISAGMGIITDHFKMYVAHCDSLHV